MVLHVSPSPEAYYAIHATNLTTLASNIDIIVIICIRYYSRLNSSCLSQH